VRGNPIDKLVSEMMILANSRWGGMLADRNVAGIYRAQTGGKVRMTLKPAPHEGLGVAHYTWSTSPLRRYVDLLNQRQILAVAAEEMPPHAGNDPLLFAAVRDFELAYDAYNEFQRGMERYWCLRWLQPGRHSGNRCHGLAGKPDSIRRPALRRQSQSVRRPEPG
jgi:exoribonuclease II